MPIWNSTTSKWTPGAPGGGTVSDGSGTTTTPEFAESTSAAHIIQYRTPAQALSDMGAAAAPGNATDESSSWSLSNSEPYRVNCSTACTGTLPSTISTGFVAAVNNVGTATVTIAGGGPTLVCAPVVACTIPPGGNGLVYTDGTDWYLIDGGNATEINGGAVPASAAVIATNSSAQPVSAATTGSGNVVLATSPTLSGATLGGTSTMQGNVTLENGANSNQTLAIQPGSSAEQIGAVQFNSYTGTSEWQVRKDASNNLRVTDAVNSLDRVILPANANTTINAGAGANAVAINNTSGSGTSGFIVYEGGSNYSTTAFQVSGSGNTTATGYLQGKFIMGSGTMGVAAGAAAGSSPTHCVRDEPCVRRRKRDCDADDGNEPDDRNAGDAELSEHAHQPGQLHSEHAERDRNGHQQHVDGEHDGGHDHGKHGADCIDGIHDQVLVRQLLRHKQRRSGRWRGAARGT